jgi:malonate-semialdehyde dehydrogenase (acetylating)/methylmalonate-semialdehyde dehydrogenase
MAVEAATRTMKNYVGGAWADPEAGETLPVTNPATGELLAEVPLSDTSDVDRAVRAAREAFPGSNGPGPASS